MEFTAKSGARVVINPAPWKDAKQLKKVIQRELAACNIWNDLQTALLLDGSDAVDAALQPCLIRCTRNDIKITDTTFDDVDARQDYHEIVAECVRVNIGPLVETLSTLLEKLVPQRKKTEKPPE